MFITPSVIALGIAWIIAHTIKYIIAFRRGEQQDLTRQLFISGGMPSSHASVSVAVWTVILMTEGSNSGLFGLATLVTLIICYDAVKVRRSVGEQGIAIRRIINKQKLDIPLPRAAKGHTPLELLVGGCLGFVVGIVVFFATR